MNPKSYRIPNNLDSTRVRCPVCHEAVYGRGGIHPQCAVRQSDPPRPKNTSKKPPGSVEQPAKAVEQVVASAVVDLITS